jgi:glucosamine-6-phosphate deaminase
MKKAMERAEEASAYLAGSGSAPEVPIENFRVDKLNVYVCSSRQRTLKVAAAVVAAEMRRLICERGRAVGVFASSQSLAGFLDELVKAEGIEWTKVIGLHLDEYLGADEDSPRSQRRFLIDRLVKRVPMAEFHGLRGEAANPQAVCANYAALLKSRPPDFATLALGENGRLASINPSLCDFNDPAMVRVVELDENSHRAISLTTPAIMACPKLFLIAPDAANRQAARATIEEEITTACPASILRTHDDAHMFTLHYR